MIEKLAHSGTSIYSALLKSIEAEKPLFAILFDPEELSETLLTQQLSKLPVFTTHILVGGSTATQAQTQIAVNLIKQKTSLPVLLFPGDYRQITAAADGILFLSLLSGENPEYLIRQQIQSVGKLRASALEIIPTGYILIDGGKQTTVERVSQTQAIPQELVQRVVDTALAGEYSGKKLIYLEAGSGALNPVSSEIIQAVKEAISIPLIVGGGIRNPSKLQEIYNAGADLVVVGTAFEQGDFQYECSI